MNILASVLAFFSLVLSGYALHKANKSTKKGMSNKFFNDIFEENIIKIYPKLLNDLINSSGDDLYLICDEFEKTTTNVLDSILFYKFFENIFYESIKSDLVEIEDSVLFIMMNYNNCTVVNHKKTKIEESFKCFYSKLSKYYLKI